MPVLRFSVFALCALVACGGGTRSHGSVVDDFGLPIEVRGTPRRIVSLNPTTTEILFAIGAGPRVVGRSEYDVWPPEARSVPSLGAALRPNTEAILGAHPDLVVLYGSEDDRQVAERLRQLHIPTVGLKIDRIDEFDRETRLLGRLVGDSAQADTLATTVLATLASVRKATDSLPRVSVFIPVWDRPLMTVGRGSYLTDLLAIAGGRNVYATEPGVSLTVTLEDVARRNPDVVLTTPEEARVIANSPAWRVVPAVRAGRVYAYDTALVARPSVQLGAAARSLAALLHPSAH